MWTRVVHQRWWMAAAMAAFAFVGTGCDDKVKTENAALKNENTELQTQLQQTREELEKAQADRARLTDQLAKSSQPQADVLTQGSAPRAVTGSSAGGSSTGFEGLETSSSASSITVKLPGDVLFDSGRATLRPAAQRSLNQVASAIRSRYSGSTIRIEGYTDSDPIRKSSWGTNEALSKARAEAVRKYLAAQGVRNNMVTVGMGSANPRSTKAASRRVEIVVSR